MKKEFKCTKCGECCRQLVISITSSDILRWYEQGRKDILKEITFCKGAPQGDGFYIEKTIVAPKQACPFLINNECSIHDTKPVCCKDAPSSLTKFDCCPVWNKSFINKKRLKKIQKRQDKDFKNCVVNFKKLLEITMTVKGFNYKVDIINGN